MDTYDRRGSWTEKGWDTDKIDDDVVNRMLSDEFNKTVMMMMSFKNQGKRTQRIHTIREDDEQRKIHI